MSMIYKVKLGNNGDILNSENESYIERCKHSPYVAVVAEDKKGKVYLTCFTDDNTLSIIKVGKLTIRFKRFIFYLTRKLLKEMTDNVFAWVDKKDSGANRFIRLLGFEADFEKMGYYRYRRSW